VRTLFNDKHAAARTLAERRGPRVRRGPGAMLTRVAAYAGTRAGSQEIGGLDAEAIHKRQGTRDR
jgi:hypothetical protein